MQCYGNPIHTHIGTSLPINSKNSAHFTTYPRGKWKAFSTFHAFSVENHTPKCAKENGFAIFMSLQLHFIRVSAPVLLIGCFQRDRLRLVFNTFRIHVFPLFKHNHI